MAYCTYCTNLGIPFLGGDFISAERGARREDHDSGYDVCFLWARPDIRYWLDYYRVRRTPMQRTSPAAVSGGAHYASGFGKRLLPGSRAPPREIPAFTWDGGRKRDGLPGDMAEQL